MINVNTPLPNQDKLMFLEELKWADLYWLYFKTFIGISQIVFEYEGMPDTVNVEYLEKRLLFDCYCFFFQDPILSYLTLGGSYRELDVYGWPAKFEARGQDGYYFNSDLDNTNCVMIYDNIEKEPIIDHLATYANRLADIVIAQQANIRKQKTPYIISADDDTILSLNNILRDINANLPAIITKVGFNKEDISVWNLTAPLIVKDLREEFTACFNEALTYIGIPNVQMQKRERMISDEVNRSLGGVEANMYRRYQARVYAVDKINKMFGLDITVKNRFWEGKEESFDDILLDTDFGSVPEPGEEATENE